jgi:hypothetical protein
MGVLLSTHGSRGNAEPMRGLVVQLGALGRAVEVWDPAVATGVIPAGGWR